jgi:hypothetical protein
VPASVIASLAEFGKAVIAGRGSASPVQYPQFGWDYMAPVVLAMNGAQRNQVIQELYDAALTAADRPMASVGAYKLLCESDGDLHDERFVVLRDAYLELAQESGFSSGNLTGYEAQRWNEVHGNLRYSFDRITDVAVPPVGQAPLVPELQPGQEMLIALTGPLPEGNEFFAERRQDGIYGVFSIRPRSSDDHTRERYDEHLGPFSAMPELLRAVGEYFRLKPYWAHEDLDPYFPGRRG